MIFNILIQTGPILKCLASGSGSDWKNIAFFLRSLIGQLRKIIFSPKQWNESEKINIYTCVGFSTGYIWQIVKNVIFCWLNLYAAKRLKVKQKCGNAKIKTSFSTFITDLFIFLWRVMCRVLWGAGLSLGQSWQQQPPATTSSPSGLNPHYLNSTGHWFDAELRPWGCIESSLCINMKSL